MTPGESSSDPDEFFRSSREELRRFAQSLLSRGDVPSGRLDADDVVQHTMTEVISRWDQIKDPRRYMFKVARHYVVRAIHEGQRFTGAPLEADGFETVADETSLSSSVRMARPADDVAFERITTLDLYSAVDNLSPQQRRAVELVDLGCVSRAAAAVDMAVSVGAVSAHRDRGLKKMRSILRAQGGFLLTVLAVLASIVLPVRGRQWVVDVLGSSDTGGHRFATSTWGWTMWPYIAAAVGVGFALIRMISVVVAMKRVATIQRRLRSPRPDSNDASEPAVSDNSSVDFDDATEPTETRQDRVGVLNDV